MSISIRQHVNYPPSSARDYLLVSLGEPVVYGPTIREIQDEICEKYGITRQELLSERRGRKIAWPRQEAMWRASKETKSSLPMIGRAFERDHTTVLYAIRRHEQRLGQGA